jgi:hypothetical protein
VGKTVEQLLLSLIAVFAVAASTQFPQDVVVQVSERDKAPQVRAVYSLHDVAFLINAAALPLRLQTIASILDHVDAQHLRLSAVVSFPSSQGPGIVSPVQGLPTGSLKSQLDLDVHFPLDVVKVRAFVLDSSTALCRLNVCTQYEAWLIRATSLE